MGALPNLQNAFLRYTGITGQPTCSLVNNTALTRLSISGNNLAGSLPACFLSVGDPHVWVHPAAARLSD